MNIYFAGSIRGGREDQELYSRLIRHLSLHGRVLTEHVGEVKLSAGGEEDIPDDRIFERDISWIRDADVVIAEVSVPSTGVGYEIGFAEGINKPVLCLYREQENKKLSAMIAGNPGVTLVRYTTFEDAVRYIDAFFTSVRQRI